MVIIYAFNYQEIAYSFYYLHTNKSLSNELLLLYIVKKLHVDLYTNI